MPEFSYLSADVAAIWLGSFPLWLHEFHVG